jgi:hypothetical protein
MLVDTATEDLNTEHRRKGTYVLSLVRVYRKKEIPKLKQNLRAS